MKDKKIDYSSLEIDGIDTKDYPDFCDAFIISGQYLDGDELDDVAIDDLNGNGELVLSLVYNRLF